MKFNHAVILLPCHSLEDFPVHLVGDEAHEILAGWTALWHPAAIAAFRAPPSWHRADDPPAETEHLVALIPSASRHELQPNWEDKAQQTGTLVLTDLADRGHVVANVFAAAGSTPAEVSDELVADFWALATAYLIVELLTRQMRYYSNLDDDRFRDEATKAATLAVEGDEAAAREHLQICHDMLAESRNQFYPVDSYLIDLTLVADSSIGAALADEARSVAPTNLLMTGATLDKLAQQAPDVLAAVREGLDHQTLTLLGGEYAEDELPLQSMEQVLRNFERGREAFMRHLGQVPRVYGRRRFGLSPVLPLVLSRLGYLGALHATLDAGIFPEGSQAKTRWESHDGSTVDALASIPRDARLAESILAFPRTLGEAMDVHHVACVSFAHWPGQTSIWYEDLRRAARFGPSIGKFVTLEEFFNTSSMVDSNTRFEVDEYISPYLRQAVDAGRGDPISEPIARQAAAAQQMLSDGLRTLETVSSGKPIDPGDRSVSETMAQLAPQLVGNAAGRTPGVLLVNPTGTQRRLNVEVSGLAGAPEISAAVRTVDNPNGALEAIVDVPAMGFVYAAATSANPSGKEIATAEGNLLRNDHLEILVNRTTGALQAIHQHGKRGNRLSQQLVLFERESGCAVPGEQPVKSVMVADDVQVTRASRVVGEITCRGRLVDREGQRLASFTQIFRLWRGSRVLDLEIELDPATPLGADPWSSYFASRVAWKDETAILWRSHLGGSHPTLSSRFDAPEFIEIRDPVGPVTLLTGGLSYHRKLGFRMLDTLLLVRGEERRKFRLGIGVELAHPAAAAIAQHQPAAMLTMPISGPAGEKSAWLFHQDSNAVIATHWSVLDKQGKPIGIRVRLLETEGRRVEVRLAGFCEFQQAQETDLAGNVLRTLEIEAGAAAVSLQPHDWVQIEAFWQPADSAE